jgi:co-chaperonin GroES (HSP10)
LNLKETTVPDAKEINAKLNPNTATNIGKYTLPDVTLDQTVAYAAFVMVREESPREYQGKIVIPDSVKKREWSKVISVGPLTGTFTPKGETTPRRLEPGDLVMYYQGVNTVIDGVLYVCVTDSNIMVVYPGNKLPKTEAATS